VNQDPTRVPRPACPLATDVYPSIINLQHRCEKRTASQGGRFRPAAKGAQNPILPAGIRDAAGRKLSSRVTQSPTRTPRAMENKATPADATAARCRCTSRSGQDETYSPLLNSTRRHRPAITTMNPRHHGHRMTQVWRADRDCFCNPAVPPALGQGGARNAGSRATPGVDTAGRRCCRRQEAHS
jgi:hypothetical protein